MNPDDVSSILIESAERFILPRHQNLKDHEISTKSGPTDFVTQADLDVEEHLTRVLPDLLPGSKVVGEEAVAQGKTDHDSLLATDGPLWVIDPVDGTQNFVEGGNQFGILLALVDKGETRTGWIYDVMAKRMTVAERGAGAFANGHKLKIQPTAPNLGDLSGFIGVKFAPEEHRAILKQKMNLLKNTKPLFSAVHVYLSIVENTRQFAMFRRTKPWDHLAGCLAVEEAGGYVRRWNNEPYDPRSGDAACILAASSPEIWDAIFNDFIKDYI